MGHSRTTNSIFNFLSGMGGQIISIAMEFLVRTVFIATLGKTYLGLNGLFSNILTMLSLAELGVGSAILFKLYKPIAENDDHRILLLICFYRKAYAYIGFFIAAVGILLIPLLPSFVKDYNSYTNLQVNLTFIFLLFLSRTVSSYFFFAYKSALIKAYQKEYLLNIISYFFTIGTAIIRIIALYLWPRFEIYVIISVASTILQNIAYAWKANKLFPYLKTIPKESISKEEKRSILKDCGALLIYKMNSVVLKGTDNIIISTFLGLEVLGMYTNYYLFFKTINSTLNRIYNSIAHGLGNLHATASIEKQYYIFQKSHLITAILGGVSMVTIGVVADGFINIWIGKEWVFDQPVALLISIEVYTLAYRHFLNRYRTSMGLFRQALIRPLLSMIINLVISLLAVRYWGVCGVLAGTIIADWTTCIPYDPIVIHRYGFNDMKKIKKYYFDYIKYFISSFVLLFLLRWGFSLIFTKPNILSLLIQGIACVILSASTLLLVSWKTPERKDVVDILKKYIRKVIPIINP